MRKGVCVGGGGGCLLYFPYSVISVFTTPDVQLCYNNSALEEDACGAQPSTLNSIHPALRLCTHPPTSTSTTTPFPTRPNPHRHHPSHLPSSSHSLCHVHAPPDLQLYVNNSTFFIRVLTHPRTRHPPPLLPPSPPQTPPTSLLVPTHRSVCQVFSSVITISPSSAMYSTHRPPLLPPPPPHCHHTPPPTSLPALTHRSPFAMFCHQIFSSVLTIPPSSLPMYSTTLPTPATPTFCAVRSSVL